MDNDNSRGTNNSRLLAGGLIIAIGVLFLIKQAGFSIFPYWLFTWPMILIAIGVFLGIKHNFRGSGWLIMLIIGGFFLVDDIMDMYPLRHYLVPAILIGVGIMVIARPKNKGGLCGKKKWDGDNHPPTQVPPTGSKDTFAQAEPIANDPYADASERMDATAIFGSVKKNIVSKNFRGGEATSIFGGSEIDLSQADINGTVKMEVTAILGGVKLIVPSHWTVRQDVTAIFGGVEDKRDAGNIITAQNKVLVLDGTAFMGGIEIVSYR